MTAHLAWVMSPYVIVVGDRLLTVNNSGRITPWELSSNKTILVVARNACVVVSFSGLAHIGERPTDAWLVDVISRREPDPPSIDGHPWAFRFGFSMPDLTYGAVRERIIEGLRKDFAVLDESLRSVGLTIMIAGWTWKRRHPTRPRMSSILNFITSDGCMDDPGYTAAPRVLAATVGFGRYRRLASIGAMGGEMPTVRALLRQHRRVDELDIEAAMVADIRDRSERPNTTVGREYMSVFLPSIGGTPYIKYIRDPALPSDGQVYWPAIVHWQNGIVNPVQATCSPGSTAVFGIPMIVDPPCPPHAGVSMIGGQPRRPRFDPR